VSRRAHIRADDYAAIIEHGTDESPMMFYDVEDALRAWVDFHEQFGVPFSNEEITVLGAYEVRQ
jgi:hypothetical protein